MTPLELDDDLTMLAALAALPPEEQARALRRLTKPQVEELEARWPIWAHDGQLSPDGEPPVWLIMAGRGFGKTRAGSEWMARMMRDAPGSRFALVGATIEDARKVMVEGPAGLLAIARRRQRVRWHRHTNEVKFANGAIATVFGATAPEALRGPEHHAAWCDEIGKWGLGGDDAFNNLMLGLRGSESARMLVTTTPRATPLMTRVIALAEKDESITRGRSIDNPHLPATFLAAMIEHFGGTRLGRQELDGELVEDRDGALWSRDLIERCRIAAGDAPVLTRIVVAVDPPAGTEDGGGDACGIVVAALGEDGLAYVVEDATIAASSPARWAAAVADCARRWRADRVIAEKNQGGEMVRAVLKAADPGLPLALVSASKAKARRAEPVSLAYEQGRVRHAGAFPALEDQLCGMMVAGGYAGPGRSPDRADALVWALGEVFSPRRRAAVRRV